MVYDFDSEIQLLPSSLVFNGELFTPPSLNATKSSWAVLVLVALSAPAVAGLWAEATVFWLHFTV